MINPTQLFYALTMGLCQMALSETATIAKITDGVPARMIGPVNVITGLSAFQLPFGVYVYASKPPGRSILEPSSSPNGYFLGKVGSVVVQSLAHSLDLFLKKITISSGIYSYQLTMRAAPSYRVIDFVLKGSKYVPKVLGASNFRELRPMIVSNLQVNRLFLVGENDRSYIEFDAAFRLSKIVADTRVTTIAYDGSGRLSTITDPYGNYTTFVYVTGGFDVLYASKSYQFRFGPYGLASVKAYISSTSIVPLYNFGYPSTTTTGSCKGLLSYVEFAKTGGRLNLVYKSCATTSDGSPRDLTVSSFHPSDGLTKNGPSTAIYYPNGYQVAWSSFAGAQRWTYALPPAFPLIRPIMVTDGIKKTNFTYDTVLSYLPASITELVYPITAPIAPLPRSTTFLTSFKREPDFGLVTEIKLGSRILETASYNSEGQLTFRKSSLGPTTTIYYNSQGQPYQIKTGGADSFDKIDITYNIAGFLSKITLNDLPYRAFDFDPNRLTLGLVTSVTDENGRVTTYSYSDPWGANAWLSPYKLALKSITSPNADQFVNAMPSLSASGSSYTASQFFNNGDTTVTESSSKDMLGIPTLFTNSLGPKFTKRLSNAVGYPRVQTYFFPGNSTQWTVNEYALKSVTVNGVADKKDWTTEILLSPFTTPLSQSWEKTSHLPLQPVPQ